MLVFASGLVDLGRLRARSPAILPVRATYEEARVGNLGSEIDIPALSRMLGWEADLDCTQRDRTRVVADHNVVVDIGAGHRSRLAGTGCTSCRKPEENVTVARKASKFCWIDVY